MDLPFRPRLAVLAACVALFACDTTGSSLLGALEGVGDEPGAIDEAANGPEPTQPATPSAQNEPVASPPPPPDPPLIESDSTSTVFVGTLAPGGTLLAEDGSPFELAQAFSGQNAALIFYRGFW